MLAAVANCPNVALTIASSSIWQSIAAILLPSLLICIAIYVLSPRFYFWLFYACVPLAFLEVIYVIRYEGVTDEHVFAIVRETNYQEAIVWLGPLGWVMVVGSVLLIIAPVLIRRHATL